MEPSMKIKNLAKDLRRAFGHAEFETFLSLDED